MKVLMLIDSFTVGGAQRQFTTLSKELHKKHDVTVIVYHPITSHFENELNADNIRIVKILKQSRFDFRFIFKLLKFIRKEKFDVCISFLNTPNSYNVLAKITHCVPKIIVGQRSAYFKESLSLKRRFQESLLYFSDYITTNSITQKQRMEDIFPFLKDKIYYVPNVYDTSMVVQKLNFKKNFIVLSNTQINKNPLQLCQALVEYKRMYGEPKFRIKWYGRISKKHIDKTKLDEGIKILEDNGLYSNLTFEGITDTPLLKLKESDLLIHISNFEGCPNSVCEAMITKTPVLVSNVCDAPILLNNNSGILVNQLDPIDIANSIKTFETFTEEEIISMTENAYNMIRDNYNKNVAFETLNTLIVK